MGGRPALVTGSQARRSVCWASGGWAAKSLILVRGSLRGNARHVYEVVDDNTYNLKIQYSPDAEGWSDVLTGTYRRVK